jgi:hypothetical protein
MFRRNWRSAPKLSERERREHNERFEQAKSDQAVRADTSMGWTPVDPANRALPNFSKQMTLNGVPLKTGVAWNPQKLERFKKKCLDFVREELRGGCDPQTVAATVVNIRGDIYQDRDAAVKAWTRTAKRERRNVRRQGRGRAQRHQAILDAAKQSRAEYEKTERSSSRPVSRLNPNWEDRVQS